MNSAPKQLIMPNGEQAIKKIDTHIDSLECRSSSLNPIFVANLVAM